MRIFLLIFISFFILSCKQNNDCSYYYDEYLNFYMKNDISQAIDYINMAIDCDKNNDNYKSDKVNLFIRIKKYDKALIAANSMTVSSTSYLIKGVLLLKTNSKDSSNIAFIKALKKLRQLKNSKNLNKNALFSIDYNITILSYHLEGHNKGIQILNRFKLKHKTDYQKEMLNSLQNMIMNLDSKTILFNLFGIEM